ncbi:toprim domain-containing protein [Pinibacter soli]|uniref:Toprim domain-containing protein n=1 Tax=Pinibacter soli TaxID=3044211 RepID=A0ABT6RFL3_9BACT|nr:toprim domain-containing protein [Pinibacter soli]MDI3321313.1 toprim domain-containing protein [Pinibacter soli]
MDKEYFNTRHAKSIDIVDWLTKKGHSPQKISGNDYWYLSPLRQEKTASFKVNRKLNVWYDHGLGKGGNMIDLGILYYGCNVKELLQKLKSPFLFQPQEGVKNSDEKHASKITILDANQPISNGNLLAYLQERNVSLEVAIEFLYEVDFETNSKRYYALGFKNNSGGFELRNKYFKGSSSPKDTTLIDQENVENLLVFEGFFSFLSYETMHNSGNELTNFLVLNSLSFFEKSIEKMMTYTVVKLCLDNDPAGERCVQLALKLSEKFKDERHLYKDFKDLNDQLMHLKPAFKQRQRLR